MQVCGLNLLRKRLADYIGNGLNVVKVMPESAIKFGAYEASLFVRLWIHTSNKLRRPSVSLLK
jgi:solute carrier family 25 phosphate transporter 23/24/25/41